MIQNQRSVRRFLVFLLGSSLLGLLSCSAGKPVASSAKGAFSVDGTWITQKDIAQFAELIKQGGGAATASSLFEAPDTALMRAAAMQLAANQMILVEARRRGLTCDSARMRQAYQQIRGQFPDEAAFQRQLTAGGQSEATFRSQMEEGLLVEQVVRDILAAMDSVSDADCRAYHKENAAKFGSQKKVRMSQVFFRMPSTTSDGEKALVRQKAEAVLAQCRAKGSDFAALAKTHSEGPEASSGGDLGWFAEGDLNPVFEGALASLAVGGISDVLVTDYGLHILRKVEEKTTGNRPFADVKKDISLTLEIQRRNERMKQYIDSLAQTCTVVYADTSYRGLF